jgi:hypothetical protein
LECSAGQPVPARAPGVPKKWCNEPRALNSGHRRGVEHVGAWNYIYSGMVYGGTTPLDTNQDVIQDELLSTIASFAADGTRAGQGTPAWPRFNRGRRGAVDAAGR